ncbi:GNAT family N-acetyltransferase [Actinopolymorpha rutila]|uniref:Diamine N-acetyltransferase n=1 Tax=Actinopolymorpha rutila TaxID=446787 RepID=A0A852ZVN3_9ACTN|nr:GNAT family N-acetyltransferase [Actinopolymorpha rutila]NYH93379.1 diamine N-acetyltransferase [Actinopolymorpha rutila]
MASGLRLVTVTPENVGEACRLRVRPEQRDMVAPVAWSLAEAYVHGEKAWPRVVCDGDQLVGFVMAAFDAETAPKRCGIWRLNIAADHQRRGYGRFAVEAVCREVLRRGGQRLSVRWVPDEHGPEDFYRRLGFQPTGQIIHGEVEAELLVTENSTPAGLPARPDRG